MYEFVIFDNKEINQRLDSSFISQIPIKSPDHWHCWWVAMINIILSNLGCSTLHQIPTVSFNNQENTTCCSVVFLPLATGKPSCGQLMIFPSGMNMNNVSAQQSLEWTTKKVQVVQSWIPKDVQSSKQIWRHFFQALEQNANSCSYALRDNIQNHGASVSVYC